MKHNEPTRYLVDDHDSAVKVFTIETIAERWPHLVAGLLQLGCSFELGHENPSIDTILRWRVSYQSVDSYGKSARKICKTLAAARKFIADHAGEESLSPDSGGVSNDGIVRWTGIEAQSKNFSFWERAPRSLIQSA